MHLVAVATPGRPVALVGLFVDPRNAAIAASQIALDHEGTDATVIIQALPIADADSMEAISSSSVISDRN